MSIFADDTSLIFNIERAKSNFDDVNNALSRVLTWFTANNLQLNSKKTKCMNFTLPNIFLTRRGKSDYRLSVGVPVPDGEQYTD